MRNYPRYNGFDPQSKLAPKQQQKQHQDQEPPPTHHSASLRDGSLPPQNPAPHAARSAPSPGIRLDTSFGPVKPANDLGLIRDDALGYQAIEDFKAGKPFDFAVPPGESFIATLPLDSTGTKPAGPVTVTTSTGKPMIVPGTEREFVTKGGIRFTDRELRIARPREAYRWMPHLGGWVYRGIRG